MAYIALALAVATGWVINRTALGLEIRACGESVEVAHTLAIPVKARRTACILFGGITAGLGGAYLSVVQVHAFVEGMVAGRGFLAVACVMLGRKRPLIAFLASLGFGLAEATQIRLQTLYPGLAVPVPRYPAVSRRDRGAGHRPSQLRAAGVGKRSTSRRVHDCSGIGRWRVRPRQQHGEAWYRPDARR